MKKLMFLVLVLALVFGISSGTVFAQSTASIDATANVYAEVIQAFDVANVDGEDLDFGTLAASADTGGTITVTAGGTSSTSNIPYHDGLVSAAQFEITGGYTGSGILYTVDLPDSVTIFDGTDTYSMLVNGFTDNADNLITTTSEIFSVGATLNVGAGQEPGIYSGEFTVTINFE